MPSFAANKHTKMPLIKEGAEKNHLLPKKTKYNTIQYKYKNTWLHENKPSLDTIRHYINLQKYRKKKPFRCCSRRHVILKSVYSY